MSWILGTAGHIDHGKTSLVKALTGRDTDRLKEEQERGISIDLGFASLDLPGGTRVGVVDVPGHERFIRNMLAGAHGIDLALFTVAADDGVMPQTEEHLDIVHLLGVSRAIFVITKIDLVAAGRVDEVARAIRALAEGTAFERAPIQPCSVVTGEGLDALRALIGQAIDQAERPRSGGFFRLPIDRVFLAQGHGLVVTGTAIAGRLEAGAHVRCLPGGSEARVRSIQVHDQNVTAASAGQRVALNLGGLDKGSLTRGDVVCDSRLTRATTRFDARFEIRGGGEGRIKSHQRIRLHLGTAERLGRIIFVDPDALPSLGKSCYCQIAVSGVLHALRGDRFIVRDETARRTLGGGTIIDPYATPLRRRDPSRAERLQALEVPSPADVLRAYVERSQTFTVPWSLLCQFLNDDRPAPPATEGLHIFQSEVEPVCAAASRYEAVGTAVLEHLARFHAAQPLATGLDVEEARALSPERMSARVFRELVEALEASGSLERQGNFLRARGYQVRLSEPERELVDRIEQAIAAQPLTPPETPELQVQLGVDRSRLLELLRVMEQARLVVRVTPTMYFQSSAIERLRDELRRRLAGGGTITAAQLRDQLKTSRKFAIPLLEYFDRTGVTVRVGDARKLRHPLERSPA